MRPILSTGALARILDTEEEVTGAIVQFLASKEIPGAFVTRYRLLISDGVIGCPYFMLSTQLNDLITNNELVKYTIIRIDKYVCSQCQPDIKVIILLSLTILTPGAEVNEKIGEPIWPRISLNAAATSTTETNSNNEAKSTFTSLLRLGPKSNITVQNERVKNLLPVCRLTPSFFYWTVKVRVTNKTPITTYNNSSGEGVFFSVSFMDQSGEIKATGFNECVVQFYALLELNKVFYISKATVERAGKNNSVVTSDTNYFSGNNIYEMILNENTSIIPCQEGLSSIPIMMFDFVPIANIENVFKDTYVDVIGVCKFADDVQTFISQTTKKEHSKQDIILVDQTNKAVNVILWGTDTEKINRSSNPVIAIKAAKVSGFNGRSLFVTNNSIFLVNPDIKEAHLLKGWYERVGCNLEPESLSRKQTSALSNLSGGWKALSQVYSELLSLNDKPVYYVHKATVLTLKKENCLYMACPSEDCNNKVVEIIDGLYHCGKCNCEYSEFKWHLLLSANIADFAENQWVVCFQEAAEFILGVKAQELGTFYESDKTRFDEVFTNACFKSYIFKMRSKMVTFNEESFIRTVVVSVSNIDPVSYTKKLFSDIKQIKVNNLL